MGLHLRVLWVGRAERFAAAAVSRAPSLDVVWERDLAGAAALARHRFDACVLDLGDAEAALAALGRDDGGRPPTLVLVDEASDDRAEALRAAGAAAVLERSGGEPSAAALLQALEAIVRPPAAPSRSRRLPDYGLVGESPALERVRALIERAGRCDAPVLVAGETGTGKELVARAVHGASPRRRRPFVALNCAALPDTLLESELLGHVRGAFTGAERDRRGLVEEADGGTLLLDEVGDTSPAFQAKLLRVLQEGEVRPLGSARSRRVDVRVVAATHRDLHARAREGRFREDLFYRLAVFPIALPALRERAADLPALAAHLLAQHRAPRRALSPEAVHLLQTHRWPGNVRELHNELQRALALAEDGEPLAPHHFSDRVRGALPADAASLPALPSGETLRDTVARLEAWVIRRSLAAHAGRRTATARALGLTREGLYKKMKRLGIG